MQVVIKKEVVELYDVGIIYPTSDRDPVSPVQFVCKRGGMTIVNNKREQLISNRKVTGWRMFIDYRKLNDASWKDHFPSPAIITFWNG